MGTVVNLDPGLEQRLRQEARDQNVDFDSVLNEAVRSGLAAGATRGRRFVQKTYSAGPPLVDITMAFADELEDEERIRKIRQPEGR